MANTELSHTTTNTGSSGSAGTSGLSHEDRLRDNITGLIALCIDIITDAQNAGFTSINIGLMDIALAALSKWNPSELIDDFIKKSHPYWDQIRLRDQVFFESNMAEIFAKVPLIDMSAVAALFQAKHPDTKELLVPDADREAIWDFLSSMVKICIKFIHQERKPCLYPVGDGKYRPFYQTKFFPLIKLEKYAVEWDIRLEFN
jgi:hypothetical protein